jgi:ribosome maturation factor RimP
MWGSSPTFFFAAPDVARPMPLDALLDPIREQIASLGFELVDLRRAGTLDRPILQLRVDRPDSRPGHGVTAEDCATISRVLERFLESRGLVGPRYVLEVSSPGAERPLRWPEHWRRFVGQRVRVRAQGLTGRPEASIVAVPDDEHVVLRLADGTERTLPLSAVEEARLVVDWAAYAKQQR